jgi:hypothetical protein
MQNVSLATFLEAINRNSFAGGKIDFIQDGIEYTAGIHSASINTNGSVSIDSNHAKGFFHRFRFIADL